jgi:putative alpha-1,2-mannosidase
MHNCNNLRRWDTHRSLNPWLVLFEPQMAFAVVQSLLTMARDGGDLPKWPLANVCDVPSRSNC